MKSFVPIRRIQLHFLNFAVQPFIMNSVKIVATDLDGTFLRNDKSISSSNIKALHSLGCEKIIRVAATGRNLLKTKEVIPDHIPFDYIVYSSGAGVYDWQEQRHIHTRNIPGEPVNILVKHFVSSGISFHAFWPAPFNHYLWYHRGSKSCPEFERYNAYSNSSAFPFPVSKTLETEMCQFLIILKGDPEEFFSFKNEIETVCSDIRVIRTSSPLNTGHIWLEVFHKSVSKGNGLLFLCHLLNINPLDTLGIGNDYNDIDLLEFTGHSYLTGNAPEDLKKNYTLLPSNEEDAFAFVVSKILS